ncbi:MAG TPA: TonB-dependent receptor [Allosphingosinicella sp.]|nr:TonB-dependent receptor [Allosphingosinicella sp.]
MNSLLIIAALTQAGGDQNVVVTASRTPVDYLDSVASTTTFDEGAMDGLSLPAVPDLLRLTPGTSVATTGPRGTQTQVRIRGGEASHTLVFLDGIRFNDPAAGNEARFELLTADALARLEIVRGPQSALWGSEALGGVIAAETADPFRGTGFEGRGEYGSLDSSRLSGRYALRSGDIGLAASGGWLRSDGIDSFGAGGDRDGFDNRAASVKLEARPSGAVRLGITGHYVEAESDFDGFDPVFFTRADTLDSSENRLAAVRGWAQGRWGGWTFSADASYLDSANRNFLAGAPQNQTYGDRLALSAQVSRLLGGHRLTIAAEHSEEDFRARDTAFGGFTNQDRGRHFNALIGEWRAEWTDWAVTDFVVRHDSFSAFDDATTLRASLVLRPTDELSLRAAYGEGIAQPTFYDLYGFFPGSFAGNPALRPEQSRGWEAGIVWRGQRFELAATYFSARLKDEIVDVFDPATFLSSTVNATGSSRRDGAELTAAWWHADWLTLYLTYTWLDADEQRSAATALVREIRRPRHSASFIALGESGRFSWGASLAYVGKRRDSDFDLFPASTVILDDYLLASANLAYRLLPQLELYARAENGFDADYQDVVGYNTPGRTVYAGLRVAFGD